MTSSLPRPSVALTLNETCHCVSMDHALLDQALACEGAAFGAKELLTAHPNLFSHTGVFVDGKTLSEMRGVVEVVERIVAMPSYRELALADAHEHARLDPKTRGVFLGYDFHLSDEGPQLIEINTNAGGGLLNVILRRAQRACCDVVAEALGPRDTDVSDRFVEMFRAEYRLARGDAPLRTIAIVDDDPASQYLYPEFRLFSRLFAAHGLEAFICDARALEIADGKLVHEGRVIDLVYNRATDFTLSEPEHAALGQAYREGLAVVTPHPRAHALYADKKRLVTLSDPDALRSLGVCESDIDVLIRHIPRTIVVKPEEREQLWAERKKLFFKPQSGYGSKAAYRGEKITKGAFEDVLRSPYVAQKLVPPSSRTLRIGEETRELKVDIRNFAYAGEVQLVCARLYHGQTTNFRTQGGGFAPVYETGT